MAGIGFTLKKLFQDETYTSRSKAFLYSSLIAAGPWIAAVVTVNILLLVTRVFMNAPLEREIFLGTIVYSFVFSQILTAPFQFLITRYISDKLYEREYEYIRPSFLGLNKLIFALAFALALAFYAGKPLPLHYKFMAASVFITLSMIWILMVYLSAVKNYELIAKAYIWGGALSVALAAFLINHPIKFNSLANSSNLLFSYLFGITLTLSVLLYNFLSSFYFGNSSEYDFLRYIDRFPSLFFIGLFYTLGLWADDLTMWFSIVGVNVYRTYHYAPIYDNAVFLAYLTIIPTMVLFLVSIETEFYDTYKKFYSMANKKATYDEIILAKDEMEKSIYSRLFQTFCFQALISATIVLFSKPIFQHLNISIIIRNIFRISTMGALFNIFVLLIILVLLYFESRKRALIISFIFLASNLILTHHFSLKGLEYYGYGFTAGSFLSLAVAVLMLSRFVKTLDYSTFALQPLFAEKERGIFVSLADAMNLYLSDKKLKAGRIIFKRRPALIGSCLNLGFFAFLVLLYSASNNMDLPIEYNKTKFSLDAAFSKINSGDSVNTTFEIQTEEISKSVHPVGKETKQNDNDVAVDSNIQNFVSKSCKNSEEKKRSQTEGKKDEQSPPEIVAKSLSGKYIYYRLKPGETLFSVSMKFYGHGGMVEQIKNTNNIHDISSIPSGKRLKIPDVSMTSNWNLRYYRMSPGDTLFSISMKFYGSSKRIDEIKKLNNIKSVENLPVGQIIKLP